MVFLVEARADFRQGIAVPREEPGEGKVTDGFTGFLRYACKMATGEVRGVIASTVRARDSGVAGAAN